MKMTLRWYGPGHDSVTLDQIRQIPGVTGVITTLYDIPAGEEWPLERVRQLKKVVEDAGIDARETLFIDDSLANCMAARSLGMSVLHYKPGDNLESCILKELEQKEMI